MDEAEELDMTEAEADAFSESCPSASSPNEELVLDTSPFERLGERAAAEGNVELLATVREVRALLACACDDDDDEDAELLDDEASPIAVQEW